MPERFAAILCRNGNYDLTAPDLGNPSTVERVVGRFVKNLPTPSGLTVLQRTNAAFMAGLDPRADWPVIRTISGRSDTTVGWSSSVELFAGLESNYRPAVHYFDDRDHTPRGYWADLEYFLLARTFDTRRDRPALRFSDCTIDDDAGDGDPLDGDTIGTINGYVDYDRRTASSSPEAVEFEVFVRKNDQLDDAPGSTGWARLTPRRTGPFAPSPGEWVHYTLSENGDLLDDHLLLTDADGLVHTPLTPLSTNRRIARFQRAALAALPALFVCGAPRPGERFQVLLSGRPGADWTLALQLGTALGPSTGVSGAAGVVLHGTLDEHGISDLSLPLPAHARLWPRLWAQAWIAGRMAPPVATTIQRLPEGSLPR
jgi:hypothetical protein